MTIKELIEELKKYPENMLVYLADSEYPPEECNQIRIRKDKWVWDGPNHTVQDVLELI